MNTPRSCKVLMLYPILVLVLGRILQIASLVTLKAQPEAA